MVVVVTDGQAQLYIGNVFSTSQTKLCYSDFMLMSLIETYGSTIDDLIDVFLVPLSPPDIMAGSSTTTLQRYSGRLGYNWSVCRGFLEENV